MIFIRVFQKMWGKCAIRRIWYRKTFVSGLKKALGTMKDELGGAMMKDFVGLCLNVYSCIKNNDK